MLGIHSESKDLEHLQQNLKGFTGQELQLYLNKVIHIKTNNGLYIRLTDISEKNVYPTIDLVLTKSEATEFILIAKSENTFAIRVNIDMLNQNGTFGYHLYTIPDTDILYGAGNSELYAQFILEKMDNHLLIKSAYKQTYICHEFNVIRCKPLDDPGNFMFSLENAFVPIIQNNICVISYGFLRNYSEIDDSPIIKNLKKIYPDSIIDLYMFIPNIIDEFIMVQVDTQKLKSKICSVNIKTYSYDIKQFMKLAHFHGMPIMCNTTRIYPYRTLSMLWNLSESIKYMLSAKKSYHIYILMRNDCFNCTDILCKQLDRGKLYCLNNNLADPHLMIGRDILVLEYLYDFYIKNKNSFQNTIPSHIITEFLKTNRVQLGDIFYATPSNKFTMNAKKLDDTFYRMVYEKYREIS